MVPICLFERRRKLCGIAGFTHKDHRVKLTSIQRALQALIHRGPDQQGVYESPDVALGAVRLAIIDLTGGDQPLISSDGNTVLVFNGEIYNHASLRQRLRAMGHRFISSSDTEVVVHAFRQWGSKCFSRLRGMFALAVWTQSKKQLILARDRLGIKPLYFYCAGHDILFGSEIKAIMAHPAVGRQVDIDGLNCFLRLNYVPAPYTMIQGIEKVPPGHFLEWVDGKAHLEAYWQPPSEIRSCDLEEAKEELDHLLKESISEHLIADVPVGIWASGGIDSSTIVHYASEATSRRLKTFSLTFSGRSFDESQYIGDISSRYGTEHMQLDLNEDVDLEHAIEQFAYYSDEPCADAGAVPVWFLAEMSSRYVTVALSGEGADELFGGYITYQADRYVQWFRQLPSSIRAGGLDLLRHWPVSDEKISLEYKLKRFVQGSFMSPEQAHIFWAGTFSEHEKNTLLFKSDGRPVANLFGSVSGSSELERHLRFDLQYYLPDDILCKVDRMSMAHSVEVRPPFLDHRIAEFACSLPVDLRIRGSKLKFVLRELMKDKLPPAILRHKKIGLDIPVHAWLRGRLKSFLLDVLTEESVRRTGLFRWKEVERLLKDHLERRANSGYHLWGLMILLLWMKQWKIQPSSQHLQQNVSRALVEVPTLN
jgi:asparagine synthase (glutamine-hydrolysing)